MKACRAAGHPTYASSGPAEEESDYVVRYGLGADMAEAHTAMYYSRI